MALLYSLPYKTNFYWVSFPFVRRTSSKHFSGEDLMTKNYLSVFLSEMVFWFHIWRQFSVDTEFLFDSFPQCYDGIIHCFLNCKDSDQDLGINLIFVPLDISSLERMSKQVPITYRLGCQVFFHVSVSLSSVFSLFFLSVLQFWQSLLLCLQIHWTFLLKYLHWFKPILYNFISDIVFLSLKVLLDFFLSWTCSLYHVYVFSFTLEHICNTFCKNSYLLSHHVCNFRFCCYWVVFLLFIGHIFLLLHLFINFDAILAIAILHCWILASVIISLKMFEFWWWAIKLFV